MRPTGMFGVSLWLIAAPLAAQPANPTDRDTIRFVNALRDSDGGYAPAPARPGTPLRSSLRATAAAVRAMKYLGGELTDPAETRGLSNGATTNRQVDFGDFPGEPPTVTATSVGIMTMVDLKEPTAPIRVAVIKYLVEHTKSEEDMRIAAAAFEAMQVRPSEADAWLKQIAAGRNADGTFGAACVWQSIQCALSRSAICVSFNCAV